MSTPSDDEVPDVDDEITRLLTGALENRAATVHERADAWARFEQVRPATAPVWRRAAVPMLAVAATVAVLVVLATTLTRGTAINTTDPATVPPAPTTVQPAPTPAPTIVPPTTTAPVIASVRTVDLKNFGYPASLCPDVVATNGTITLHDGIGGVDPAKYDNTSATGGWGVELVEPVVYGDLTGDGLEDAVVLLHCIFVPGDSTDTGIAIVSMTADGPVVVATLDDAGVTHTVPLDGASGTRAVTYSAATAIRIEGDLLVVDWNEGVLGPQQYTTTVRYLLQGNTLSVASETGPQAPPPDPGSTVGTAIRDVPLSSIVVPLSAGFVCQPQLAALGPLDDVTLPAEGGATVTAGGVDTGARLFLDQYIYVDLTSNMDQDNQEDLVARVRCSANGIDRSGVVVWRQTESGPVVISTWFENTVDAGATSVSSVGYALDELVVTWVMGDPAQPQGEVTHRQRWNGLVFAEVTG